jgi:thiazole synthase ThiGH ThiG subunit
MNLRELLDRLNSNIWDDATDVEILVDNGSGAAYTLKDVFDYGNSVVLIGERAEDTVTDAMVEAFGRAWEATPAGEPGARRRAGLAAALATVSA